MFKTRHASLKTILQVLQHTTFNSKIFFIPLHLRPLTEEASTLFYINSFVQFTGNAKLASVPSGGAVAVSSGGGAAADAPAEGNLNKHVILHGIKLLIL